MLILLFTKLNLGFEVGDEGLEMAESLGDFCLTFGRRNHIISSFKLETAKHGCTPCN